MAKFSKQHYQAVASILLRAYDDNLISNARVGEDFADLFERDNSRFNREHFLAVVRGERLVNSRPPR